MLRGRITVILDRLDVRLYRLEWRCVFHLKITYESGRAALGNVEYVVQYENLAVDIRTCTNADDRHFERISYRLTQLVGNTLQQHDVGTRILQTRRGPDHFFGFLRFPALHAKTANFVH